MANSVTEFGDYRQFLKKVLLDKNLEKNGYSLRSFAKNNGLSASYLSRVFSKNRNLSAKAATTLALNIGLGPEEMAHFLDLVALENCKQEKIKTKLMVRIQKSRAKKPGQIAMDSFSTVANWYHFAILALTNTRGFKSSPQWIANRLGISPMTARTAIDRLINVGMLEKTQKGYRAIQGTNLETPHDMVSTAIQQNHTQHLHLAQTALSSLSVDQREFANLTISMNRRDMASAKDRIRKFLDLFNQEVETVPGDEIYHLNVQFYQASKNSGSGGYAKNN